MNKGLNIFLVVFLCVISYVGLLLSFYSSDDSETWNPKMGYAMPTGRTYGTSAVSVDASSTGSDVAAISVRSANSMFHHRPSFSYAPAASMSAYSMGGSSSILPFGEGVGAQGASPIYATSSAEFHSFGGGGNTGGVSMSGGVVSSNSQSPIASIQLSAQGGGFNAITTSSSTSFNTSSFNNLINISPNSLIASLPASNYQGITTMGDPRAIRGRQNAAPTFNDPWWVWFNDWITDPMNNGSDYGTGNDNEYVFDKYSLEAVYQSFLELYWNSGMGNPPTYEEWLDWYQQAMLDGGGSYKYGDNTYFWQPVGDVWPLVVMLLFYAGYVFVCKRKQLKVNA